MVSSCVFVFLIFVCLFLPTPAPPALLPKKTGYNEAEAKILLNLAAGAYGASPEGCINQTFGSSAHLYQLYARANEVCDIVNSICSGYTIINEHQKVIFVVFRGTKSKKQLLLEGWNSLEPLKDFYGVGMANEYFSKALEVLWPNVEAALVDAKYKVTLEVLWPNVEAALVDAKYKDYSVTFTGHSLGGALASLAALKTVLKEVRPANQIRLMTFGQPRVGNVELARKHNELIPNSFRVVHAMDIIPHSPSCAKNHNDPRVEPKDDSKPCDPNNTVHSFHHGIEIWYPTGMSDGSKYYECLGEPFGEDFDCSDQLSFELSKYKQYIADHRYYFGHKVPPYGKLGCDPNNPFEKQMSEDEEILPEEAFEAATNSAESSKQRNIWQRLKDKLKSFWKS
uniref:Fungal lipase-like domain-containing protein n=1 Tax=Panagrolaimus sp. JU765 TaxID=591449 RepID=A0AC34QN24_9BILA